MLKVELINALDRELEIGTAQASHCLVEREVAGGWHHRIEAQVITRQRRQDADQRDLAVDQRRMLAGQGHDFIGLELQPMQAIATQFQRRQVGLEVEQPQLVGEARIVHGLEQLHRGHRRPIGAIDNEHFLLGPDPADAALEHAGLKHILHRPDLAEQGLHERASLALVAALTYVLLTHAQTPRVRDPLAPMIAARLRREQTRRRFLLRRLAQKSGTKAANGMRRSRFGPDRTMQTCQPQRAVRI